MTFVELVLVMVVVTLTVTAIATVIQRASARRRRNDPYGAMDEGAVVPPKGRQRSRLGQAAKAMPAPDNTQSLRPDAPEHTDGFYARTEQRLERLFAEIEQGTLSLDRYTDLVRADLQAAEQRLIDLQAQLATGAIDSQAYDSAIGDTTAAASALRWCLDWARQRITQ